MGRRGPPPKPSKLKKLEGTFRKDRAAGGTEMVPAAGVPVRPSWLDPEAKKEWARIVPQLAQLGVLTDIDGSMLADYCAAHSLAVKAAKQYQREGLVIKTPFGPQRHPMIKVAQEARSQARLLAGEFGLSPSARSRVKIPEKPPATDTTEAFLFGGPKLVKTGTDPEK